MCKEDKHQRDMWLSWCLALTSESWKIFSTKYTATASIVMQLTGLAILFTSAESLKNIVYRPIQNCTNFKLHVCYRKIFFCKYFYIKIILITFEVSRYFLLCIESEWGVIFTTVSHRPILSRAIPIYIPKPYHFTINEYFNIAPSSNPVFPN